MRTCIIVFFCKNKTDVHTPQFQQLEFELLGHRFEFRIQFTSFAFQICEKAKRVSFTGPAPVESLEIELKHRCPLNNRTSLFIFVANLQIANKLRLLLSLERGREIGISRLQKASNPVRRIPSNLADFFKNFR